ncbi:MAG: hypothetical protein HY661_19945 [Betaproteobacteria bacterium]|nr:hypothetical protein [Betaproteobacteria bacterium]
METFSLASSRIGFRSGGNDGMATRLAGAVVAGFDRAPAMLAIAFAALFLANHAVPAENQQFNQAARTQKTNTEVPVALLPESRRAFDDDRQMLDDLIAGIVDTGMLHKALRAAEMQNLVQPKIDRPRASYTQSAPSGPRSRPWSLAVSGTAMLWDYDHFTLTAYLPMKGRNAVKKIAEKLFDSKDVGSFVSNMQALSLIARGRINTELTYSTQFSKHSSLDASASLRLNADRNTGRSDLVVGLYYRATF